MHKAVVTIMQVEFLFINPKVCKLNACANPHVLSVLDHDLCVNPKHVHRCPLCAFDAIVSNPTRITKLHISKNHHLHKLRQK
jgi:hypothetical protein